MQRSGCDARIANISVVPLRSGPAMKTGRLTGVTSSGTSERAAVSVLIGVLVEEVEARELAFDAADPVRRPLDQIATAIQCVTDDGRAGVDVRHRCVDAEEVADTHELATGVGDEALVTDCEKMIVGDPA